MMGTQPSTRQSALFSYRVDLEPRLGPDHLLRQVAAVLDLSFVIPTVRHCYGRSGNVSLDPQVIVKLMLLLFLYNIPSERELMEQLPVRLDFLWFLGFDLETSIPDHSVLSKARKRWGEEVFEKLFTQTVAQCVGAGLVAGRLLHVDSTLVKANAHKDSVVPSGPELVSALRQAYQQQEAKLQVLPADSKASAATATAQSEAAVSSAPAPAPVRAPMRESNSSPSNSAAALPVEAPSQPQPAEPAAPVPAPGARVETVSQLVESAVELPAQSAAAATTPKLRVLPPAPAKPAATPSWASEPKPPAGQKLPVNATHISTTDPAAELARSKNGVTELNYKHHRLVDDAHGVITAVLETTANVPDGTQLPALYEQHVATTGLKPAQVTVAGDHHYGTADNYLYCAQEGIRAHLGEVSANLEERGKLPLSQFAYLPAVDRLRCPQGHELVCHQQRPEEQLKVYLIEDPALCAQCPLRAQCTQSKRGRSVRRHVRADLLEAVRQEANSPAGRYSRRRRQHVMEGTFADAVNNHGAKKARWRGLGRQKIQNWLIAAVQNLRTLLRHRAGKPIRAAMATLAGAIGGGGLRLIWGQWASVRAFGNRAWLFLALWSAPAPRVL
jgi:transposase